MAHAGGRPTKRTDDRRAVILKVIAEGQRRDVAAHLAGLHVGTFYEWQAADPEFREQIKAAEAKAESSMVAVVMQSSFTTWQAAAWWLERRKPEEYGRQDRTPVLDRETIQRIVAEMRAESGMSEEEAQAAVEAAMSIISRAQELAPQRGRKRG